MLLLLLLSVYLKEPPTDAVPFRLPFTDSMQAEQMLNKALAEEDTEKSGPEKGELLNQKWERL